MAVGIDPFLVDAATYLGAAVVAVPVAKRLGLGSVIGYLLAGAVIGPYGLGFIEDSQSVLHFAEFGVVLLLFVIGLELQPARLWRLRTEIFGLGFAQVFISAIAIAAVIAYFGWLDIRSSIAVGGALALSSTAFAIQILRERGDLNKPYGDRAFSILLFQDLSIVPLLALVTFLSPWAGQGDAVDLEKIGLALGAVLAVIVIGHYVLGPVLRVIAASKADEIFTAAALLVVIGAAIAMQYVGLSMAMGAFIAGVLLAESEFRNQIETDIEPFRGLLLGLLFIAVGMSVAWPLIAEYWVTVVFGALAIFAVKWAIIFALCKAFRSGTADALKIGAVLGQGGEFGFVLFTVAMTNGLLIQRDAFLLTAIVTATMALTPVAIAIAERVGRPKKTLDLDGISHVDEATPSNVIVVGFGRFGQIVARIMRQRGYSVTLIDSSPERIRIARTFGSQVFFGDARRGDILRVAGAAEAKAVFLCADDPEAVLHAAKTLRERYSHLLIFARVHDRVAKLEMREAGVDVPIREMFESSVAMAREALERLGDGEIADEVIDEFRRRDEELLRYQATHSDKETYDKLRVHFDLTDDRS